MSASLLELPAAQLLDRLASDEPTPGGGSAAALAGAAAAALVTMVAVMSNTRTGAPGDRARLDTALKHVRESGARLRRLVDEDAHAYDQVIAARRLPGTTDGEKAARRGALKDAIAHAAEVPLDTARACLVVLRAAGDVLAHGNPSAASDARTAGALAWAGLVGAIENVRINLESEPGHPALEEAAAIARAARSALEAAGVERA